MSQTSGLSMPLVGLLSFLVGLFYQGGSAVWDDHVLIIGHLAQLDAKELFSLWTEPLGSQGPGQGYYRPVALTVMTVTSWGGIWLVHITCAVVHAASSCMIVCLLRGHRGALLAGLCFGLHPLGSEVLGWASALPDALSVCLALAALLCIERSTRWALILAVASAASKETGILVLGALVLGLQPTRRGWACVGIGAAFVLCSRLGLGIETQFNLDGREHMYAAAVAWPMSWLAWPQPLTVVHDLWLAPKWVLWFAPTLVFVMLWLGRKSRLALIGVGLCVGAPLLALGPSVSGFMVAERYMYPALLGLALWVGTTIPIHRYSIALAAVLGSVSIGVHAQRAGEWTHDAALFEAAMEDEPLSSYSWHFLGEVCQREGNWYCVARCAYRSLVYGHPPDEKRAAATFMEAVVEVGQPEAGLQFAADHEQDVGYLMQSDYFAWAYARAAIHAGQLDLARTIVEAISIQRPPEWQAPVPLVELVDYLSNPDASSQLP